MRFCQNKKNEWLSNFFHQIRITSWMYDFAFAHCKIQDFAMKSCTFTVAIVAMRKRFAKKLVDPLFLRLLLLVISHHLKPHLIIIFNCCYFLKNMCLIWCLICHSKTNKTLFENCTISNFHPTLLRIQSKFYPSNQISIQNFTQILSCQSVQKSKNCLKCNILIKQ